MNFYQDWDAYEAGFGNVSEEHWLGKNDKFKKGLKVVDNVTILIFITYSVQYYAR